MEKKEIKPLAMIANNMVEKKTYFYLSGKTLWETLVQV